jgi:hypothetical protein
MLSAKSERTIPILMFLFTVARHRLKQGLAAIDSHQFSAPFIPEGHWQTSSYSTTVYIVEILSMSL